MNKIKKFLSKLSLAEQQDAEDLIARLVAHEWAGLNIKKLKGYVDTWRLRQGNFRIIFEHVDNKVIIIYVGRKNDNTYNF